MSASGTDTPMMRQYMELKDQVPDALLFYRMGDFYELFFDDAKTAAGALELTLTSRNSKEPDPIPMCGVPHHAADGYLRRLVDDGHKVAIAEQVADTDPGTKKKLMRRELVRVVSPGVPWDSDQIESHEACYLCGICGDGNWGLAFFDVSTGEIRITEVPSLDLVAREIQRMEPREVILPPHIADDARLKDVLLRVSKTEVDESWFDEEAGHQGLADLFGTHDLNGFGASKFGPAVGSANALVTYVRETARVPLAHVKGLQPYSVKGHMVVDQTTRVNLEVFRPLRGRGRKGTLIHLLDRTCTPMGGRCLRDWLSHPLVDPKAIVARQDAVESLLSGRVRVPVRQSLHEVSDIERLGTKASQGLANARDMRALGVSLAALPQLMTGLQELEPFVANMPSDLLHDLRDDIDFWLVDQPPHSVTDGGIIRKGAHAMLDELIELSTEGKTAIARIEAREREATGIASLKIKHNRVFGYFLEVTQANLDRVPAEWHRKQTLTNAERYITPELKEFEEKVLGADEKRKALEYELFRELRDRVASNIERLQAIAKWIARVDTLAAFAELAADKRYVRPKVDDGFRIDIRGSRHPVVESMGMDEPFVPNDIELDDHRRLMILTGPNMAGKSTVMRQVALSVLMAQVGSFVAADFAHIGISDRLFVRVGASDDLAHGRSTFMVEMSETALILNQATERSLVLLDEIGRGTSTLDGLSIAWSVAEAMHDRNRSRTIFATHYHELVELAEERASAFNMHVGVREWGDRVVFLRTLRGGGASKSYGIQCAQLAGMPAPVVGRAKDLLATLERERRELKGPQMSLFGGQGTEAVEEGPGESDALRDALRDLDVDDLSPRDALNALYRLKDLV